MGLRLGFWGIRSSQHSQILQEVLVLEVREAQEARGALAVLLVQAVLPSHSPQECQWDQGLPCFPAQVERECHHSLTLRCQLNPEAATVSPTHLHSLIKLFTDL